MTDERYFAVPFAPFDVVVIWDPTAERWRATDNGLAVASWLSAYDQWPPSLGNILGACGVECCQDEFSALDDEAEQAARRLVAALLYLDEVRKQAARVRSRSR